MRDAVDALVRERSGSNARLLAASDARKQPAAEQAPNTPLTRSGVETHSDLHIRTRYLLPPRVQHGRFDRHLPAANDARVQRVAEASRTTPRPVQRIDAEVLASTHSRHEVPEGRPETFDSRLPAVHGASDHSGKHAPAIVGRTTATAAEGRTNRSTAIPVQPPTVSSRSEVLPRYPRKFNRTSVASGRTAGTLSRAIRPTSPPSRKVYHRIGQTTHIDRMVRVRRRDGTHILGRLCPATQR